MADPEIQQQAQAVLAHAQQFYQRFVTGRGMLNEMQIRQETAELIAQLAAIVEALTRA